MAMTLKQKPNLPMEVTWVSMSEEGTAKSEQRQGQVDCFFYHEGVVHHEYAPPGQIITKEYYIKVHRWLRDTVRRKRLQFWASGNWRLYHNNATAHSWSLMYAFLGKHHITLVCQSPYSPDLAPCDFWLFPKLKSPLKARRFVNVMVTQYTSSVDGVSLLTD